MVDELFDEFAFVVAKSGIVMRLLAIVARRGDDYGETQSSDNKTGELECVQVDGAGAKQSTKRFSAIV